MCLAIEIISRGNQAMRFKKESRMTRAVAVLLISLSMVQASQASACVIKGEVKKAEAKTVYFPSGEKVSVKQLMDFGVILISRVTKSLRLS